MSTVSRNGIIAGIMEHISKSHNKNLLLYHFVFPIKYRKVVLTPEVSNCLVEVCKQISERYEIFFVEIGTDQDHAHFLIQSVPAMDIPKIVRIVKSITARQIFTQHPEVKKILWGANFWTAGYYVNTVSDFANTTVIANYVRNQGKDYKRLIQMPLFEID